MWPAADIKFDGAHSCWTSSTFGLVYDQNLINFPRLETHQINPIATDAASGPHALQKGFSLLTYMGQLTIKEQRLNLSKQETEQYLQNFPNDWRVQYCYIRTPSTFVPSAEAPRWCPSYWDVEKFGDWPGDICFVRAKIPPSQPSKVTGTMLSLVLWRRDHPDLDCCLHMTELSCGDVGGVLLSMAPCPCVDILELCCVESAILRPTDQHSDLLTF